MEESLLEAMQLLREFKMVSLCSYFTMSIVLNIEPTCRDKAFPIFCRDKAFPIFCFSLVRTKGSYTFNGLRTQGGRLTGKFLKRLVAKPYNSLHARPSRYVPDFPGCQEVGKLTLYFETSTMWCGWVREEERCEKPKHRHVSFVFKVIEFPHFYISFQVPVYFDREAIHSPLHMQRGV